MRALILFLILILTFQVSAQVKVKGYYRKDGTYVKSHYRSNPDSNPRNNWSYPGNTNPYTGETATGNPNTYLKNYDNSSSSSYSSRVYRHSTTSSSILPLQEFDFKLVDKLSEIKRSSIDDYLVQGYGFKKIEERSEDRKRVFFRMYKNMEDNAIGITVVFPKDQPNFLIMNLAKGYNIDDIKVELLEMGNEYLHRDKENLSEALSKEEMNLIDSFLVYTKDNRTYSIGKEPNEVGATEILILNK